MNQELQSYADFSHLFFFTGCVTSKRVELSHSTNLSSFTVYYRLLFSQQVTISSENASSQISEEFPCLESWVLLSYSSPRLDSIFCWTTSPRSLCKSTKKIAKAWGTGHNKNSQTEIFYLCQLYYAPQTQLQLLLSLSTMSSLSSFLWYSGKAWSTMPFQLFYFRLYFSTLPLTHVMSH